MDTLSRYAVIDTVFSMCCRWDTDDPNDLKNMLMKAFQDLPSAESPRKKGKWLHKHKIYGVTYCSECDFELHIDNTSFCPNCGADMREEREDE